MANNSADMEMDEDPLTQPPWNIIITILVSARIVLSVIGIIINGCNSVIIYKEFGNHYKLILSLTMLLI